MSEIIASENRSGFSKSEEIPINKTREYVEASLEHARTPFSYTTEFKPFLFKTVEELLEVKSTWLWKNDKVRVIGRIFLVNDNSDIKAILLSPLKTGEKSPLMLDVDSVEHWIEYSDGNLVEVFGYFVADVNDQPLLKVVYITAAKGVNIESHYKVMKLRNKYVPDYNE